MILRSLLFAAPLLLCCGGEPTGSPPPGSRPVAAVEVAPQALSLGIGDVGEATCTPRDAEGEELGGGCAWASRDSEVVTPDGAGPTTGLPAAKVGVAWIVASAETEQDSVEVSVLSAPANEAVCTGGNRLVRVASTSQLTTAVAAARPGDLIMLADGTYPIPELRVTRSGTPTSRVVLCGTRDAVLSGGFVHLVSASYWTFRGFQVTGGLWGFYQEGTGTGVVYDSVEVHHTDQEAIHILGNNTHNTIQFSYIHHTGTARPDVGECLYLGSGKTGSDPADNNHIHHNTIGPCTAEGIDVKEGTTGNLIEFNTITDAGTGRFIGSDAAIALRGNATQVLDNAIRGTPRFNVQVWTTIADQGHDNVFRRNQFGGMLGGYAAVEIYAGKTGNLVYCDNVVTGGVLGIPCVP